MKSPQQFATLSNQDVIPAPQTLFRFLNFAHEISTDAEIYTRHEEQNDVPEPPSAVEMIESIQNHPSYWCGYRLRKDERLQNKNFNTHFVLNFSSRPGFSKTKFWKTSLKVAYTVAYSFFRKISDAKELLNFWPKFLSNQV